MVCLLSAICRKDRYDFAVLNTRQTTTNYFLHGFIDKMTYLYCQGASGVDIQAEIMKVRK
jgi:hypothetical protein